VSAVIVAVLAFATCPAKRTLHGLYTPRENELGLISGPEILSRALFESFHWLEVVI
jgi:hypothetical protein